MERHFRIYLTLIFLLLPLGQFTRIEITPSLHLHLLDLVLGIGMITFLPGVIRSRPRTLLAPLVFLLPYHLSLLLNPLHLTPPALLHSYLYTIRIVSYISLIICVGHFAVSSSISHHIRRGLNYTLLVTSILGLLQYFIFPDLRSLSPAGWDPHLYRAVGTFLDPGFLGLFLLLGMAHLVLTHPLLNRPQATQIFSTLFLPFIVLCLTYSRATYLAYLVAAIIVSGIRKSLRFFVISLALFFSVLIILPRPASIGTDLTRSDSILARIENWRHSLAIIRRYPLWGVGYNAYRFAQTEFGFLTSTQAMTSHSASGADSSLLLTLATTGIAGTFLIAVLIARALTLLKDRPTWHTLALLIPTFVHSFFLNSLYYPWIVVLLVLMITPPRHPHPTIATQR